MNESSVVSVLLMGVEPQLQSEIEYRLDDPDVRIRAIPEPKEALGWIEHHRATLQAVVVGDRIDEPVRLAQRIHRLDRDIALLILTDDEHLTKVSRALQFTPFLGDYVTSHLRTDVQGISAALQDALLRGRQRRHFRSTIDAMNRQLGSMSTHRISAVQYLDHVLDHAPIGVVALDPDGYIVATNARAGEILDHSERDLLGATLFHVFANDDHDRLTDCLAQADLPESDRTPGIFSRQTGSGESQFVSVTAATLPVHPGADGTLVILQDVTTQVINERERESALQLRDVFLSMASHELKTPLTSLKGFVDLLGRRIEQEDWDRDRIMRLQAQLRIQADRLESLVTNLLDVSQIQQGGLQPYIEPLDLVDLVENVLQQFEDLSLSPGPSLYSLIFEAPEPVMGYWDADRLDQVITNLISNAIKYSPEGGEIRVVVRQDGDEAELLIQDQGIGISPDHQKRLFQPFERGNIGGDIPGTGLGLHITRQIVERHGGSIEVESQSGQGSTFIVRLPRELLRQESLAGQAR